MPKITVYTQGGKFEIENTSVENVADLLREAAEILGISADQALAVNGDAATGETALKDGDVVSATKAAGAKGV